MLTRKKTFTLLVSFALLLSGLSAMSEGIPSGQWSASFDNEQVMLILGTDGAYILKYEESTSEIHIQTGTYTQSAGILILLASDGSKTEFTYLYDDNTLSLSDDTADEWLTFTQTSYVLPEGLSGLWGGKDENGDFLFNFTEDGGFFAEYVTGEPIGSGLILADASNIEYAFNNGRHMEMSYALSGDQLDMIDKNSGESFTTHRQNSVRTAETPAASQAPEDAPASNYTNEALGISLYADPAILINDHNDEGIVYLYPQGEYIPYVMVKRYKPESLNEFIPKFTAYMQEVYKDSNFQAEPSATEVFDGKNVHTIIYTYDVQGHKIIDSRVFFLENGWIYMFAKKEAPSLDKYVPELLEQTIMNFKAVGEAYPQEANPPPQETNLPQDPQTKSPAAKTAQPQASSPAGVWEGKDEGVAIRLDLAEDGTVTITYLDAQPAKEPLRGIYLSDSNTITVLYSDGSKESYRYILMGDQLLLTDTQLNHPVTLHRVKK